jgi:hypothetical protein
MSTCVDCTIQIQGFREEQTDSIIQAVKDHLDCENVEFKVYGKDMATVPSMEFNSSFSMSGEFEEYAKAITADVWQANGEYCAVNVSMRFPEYAPVEELEGDEELYKELIIPAEA